MLGRRWPPVQEGFPPACVLRLMPAAGCRHECWGRDAGGYPENPESSPAGKSVGQLYGSSAELGVRGCAAIYHRQRACRPYADDCNVYVRSEKAGHRVMENLTRFIEGRLKLQVNAQKSAVARPWQRSFLASRSRTTRSPGGVSPTGIAVDVAGGGRGGGRRCSLAGRTVAAGRVPGGHECWGRDAGGHPENPEILTRWKVRGSIIRF